MKGDLNEVVVGWLYAVAPIGILLVVVAIVVVTVMVVRSH